METSTMRDARKSRWLMGALAGACALGLLTLSSCVGEGDAAPELKKLVFSHKIHVVDQEMKCVVCHKQAEKGELAGMPTLKTCMKCHEGLDAEKPVERRIQAYEKDGQPQFSHVTSISKDVKFSHMLHAGAKVPCASCHKGIEASKAVSTDLRLTMKDCLACHAQARVASGVKDNCKVCHNYIGKDWKPPSHLNNWKALHGHEAEFVSKNSAASCGLCHTQQTCTQCHKDEMPKNHTDYWRLRGHGVTAEFDRTCKVCHTEDSCVRCHRTTAPANHRANWEDRHCQNCHFPLKDNTCFVCHKHTPSHRSAPIVHAVPTSNDCRSCHPIPNQIPHLDNGENCLQCHRR